MENKNEPAPWEKVMIRMGEKARQKGLTYEDIAQRSGLMLSTVKRVMNLHYCPSLKVFLKIAEVIGFIIVDTDNY